MKMNPYNDAADRPADTEDEAPSGNPEGYPEITLPAGVQIEGDSGEALVNWQRKPDGTICLTAFEGKPLGKPAEESEEPEGPTPYDEIDQMAKA